MNINILYPILIKVSSPLTCSEYNDWIMMKLQKMSTIVSQSELLVKEKFEFVENYPVDELFQQNAAQLLRDADKLVASQVRFGVLLIIIMFTTR